MCAEWYMYIIHGYLLIVSRQKTKSHTMCKSYGIYGETGDIFKCDFFFLKSKSGTVEIAQI